MYILLSSWLLSKRIPFIKPYSWLLVLPGIMGTGRFLQPSVYFRIEGGFLLFQVLHSVLLQITRGNPIYVYNRFSYFYFIFYQEQIFSFYLKRDKEKLKVFIYDLTETFQPFLIDSMIIQPSKNK